MDFTQLLNRIKEAILEALADFNLSEAQIAQLSAWAEGLDLENCTLDDVLGGLARIIDGWSLPIGPCIAAIGKLIRELI